MNKLLLIGTAAAIGLIMLNYATKPRDCVAMVQAAVFKFQDKPLSQAERQQLSKQLETDWVANDCENQPQVKKFEREHSSHSPP